MKQQRNTKQKRIILAVVGAHHDHPSADKIYLEVRAIDEKISRGTVYRNLNQLAEAGELAHVKVPSADRFDSRKDFHYHVFCTDCGAVQDVPLPYQWDNDLIIARETGFQIERHRTVFEGLCPECQRKKSAPCHSG